MTKVTQDNSLDAYFDPSDPAFKNYKAFQKEFNSDEVIYLVYKGAEGEDGVFDIALMRKIDQLTKRDRERSAVRAQGHQPQQCRGDRGAG